MITFCDLQPRNYNLNRDLQAAYDRVMGSGWYIGGYEVEAFEAEFAEYVGSNHCVAVGNGYDALYIALLCGEISKGDLVGVPSNTCIPTWMAAENVGGAIQVFEPTSERLSFGKYTLSYYSAMQVCRFMIPVHLYGQPVMPQDIKAMRDYSFVVEDACQAHGTRVNGRHVGTFGQMGCFSFYPTKNLGAFGDGGAIVTDHAYLAERARELRRYGTQTAINSCLDPLQAAFLRAKLKYFDQENEKRIIRSEIYYELLENCEEIFLPFRYDEQNFHQFVIWAEDRDKLQKHLADRGVQTMVHYRDIPGEMFKIVTPIASQLSRHVLSLPIASATHSEIEYVCAKIKEFYADNS